VVVLIHNFRSNYFAHEYIPSRLLRATCLPPQRIKSKQILRQRCVEETQNYNETEIDKKSSKHIRNFPLRSLFLRSVREGCNPRIDPGSWCSSFSPCTFQTCSWLIARFSAYILNTDSELTQFCTTTWAIDLTTVHMKTQNRRSAPVLSIYHSIVAIWLQCDRSDVESAIYARHASSKIVLRIYFAVSSIISSYVTKDMYDLNKCENSSHYIYLQRQFGPINEYSNSSK
jgi:hypothetical protein